MLKRDSLPPFPPLTLMNEPWKKKEEEVKSYFENHPGPLFAHPPLLARVGRDLSSCFAPNLNGDEARGRLAPCPACVAAVLRPGHRPEPDSKRAEMNYELGRWTTRNRLRVVACSVVVGAKSFKISANFSNIMTVNEAHVVCVFISSGCI